MADDRSSSSSRVSRSVGRVAGDIIQLLRSTGAGCERARDCSFRGSNRGVLGISARCRRATDVIPAMSPLPVGTVLSSHRYCARPGGVEGMEALCVKAADALATLHSVRDHCHCM